MNKVELVGRLARDPEVRYSNNDKNTAVARFSVAVNRRYVKDSEQTADFISCVAFGKTAEFIERYFRKGHAIGITGRIQTGSYTNKDGAKVYTTDVLTEEVEFVEKKHDGATNSAPTTTDDGFMNVPDNIDEELPFN